MKKYDLHTHLLPGIDDGAKSVMDSVNLITKLSAQGVTDIALTPHYYTNKQSLESFLEDRKAAISELNKAEFINVNFYIGAEVFVTDYLFNVDSLKEVCYQNTNYLLVEMPYSCDFGEKVQDKLYRLMSRYGVVPVFAHIDRYQALMKNYKLVSQLKDMGCLTQINLGSLSKFSIRKRLFKFMKRDLIDVIATDTHSQNMGLDYNTGYNLILNKFGEEYISNIQKKAELILRP